ncbi:MAG: DUF3623 family protein [Gemmatimonadaceae bacterium]
MSDAIVQFTSSARESENAKPRSLSASLALVIAFWWGATGLTLAMQRSEAASTISLTVTTLLAALGTVLIVNARDDASVRGARFAFLGSAFVWWWCSTMFYSGFGISSAAESAGPSGSFALALQAIAATLRPDLLGVFALLAVGALVWRRANRVALWTLVVFFGTLQTAKLNVFFGVRNASVEWLPQQLSHLSRFFGPPRNSSLLTISVIGLAALCWVFANRARRVQSPFVRHANGMIALLLGLAVIEHIFLGVTTTLPLWDIFMPRG